MGGRVWIAPVASGLLLATAGAIRLRTGIGPGQLVDEVLPNVLVGTTLPVLGAAVLSRLPGHLLGRLWVTTGVASSAALVVHSYAFLASANDLPVQPAAWFASWLWVLGVIPALTAGLLLFPDGRLPSARWRPALVLAGGAVLLPALGQGFKPGEIEDFGVDNPLGGDAGISEALNSIGFLCFSLGVAAGAASLAWRWWRGSKAERDRLALPALAGAVLGATFLVPAVETLAPWLDALALAEVVLLLISFGIAVLRDQITGAHIVVRRSLAYGLLTGLLAATFAAVVAVASLALGTQSSDLVASVITALVVLPLRDRLQAVVDRALYGERSDPFSALDRFGQRMDSAEDPQAVLLGVAESVATILRLPSVRVLVQREGGEVVAATVGPEADWTRLPLLHGGAEVGALLVAPRAGQSTLDPRDVRMLEALQRQAGSAVAAVRLGVELQQSRQRLVAAREEERRRLRRDLHDGLGPTLAGIGLGLEVAKASTDPDEVYRLLQSLKEEAAAAVVDVRRLVEDLRPPALDELGLVGALQRHADRLNLGDGTNVEVVASSPLRGLPAAVEVAAYRIAMEAMTNAVRHGRPQHCALSLRMDDELHLEVTDDGRGLPDEPRPGVGLSTMTERAAELGGSCTVTRLREGGTAVVARIPLQVR